MKNDFLKQKNLKSRKNFNRFSKNIYIFKLFIIILIIFNILFFGLSYYYSYLKYLLKFNKLSNRNYILNLNNNSDYNNKKFSIIVHKCYSCGLFAFYINYLKCIVEVIILGYIPVVDLTSFSNIFNKLNISSINFNPWEIFFTQPYGYKLKDIKTKVKNIKYIDCKTLKLKISKDIFLNKALMDFWHNMALKYIPIKIEIIKESKKLSKKLFKNSNNILGILARGTDYISSKPSKHAIPPSPKIMFKDIKYMNRINKYDYYFLSTEDDLIREKFVHKFKNKLKYIKFKESINFNYINKKRLLYNKIISGNLNFMKIYLINIIILSKCIDIITANTCGSKGIFILSNGFRYSKVYNLGFYK